LALEKPTENGELPFVALNVVLKTFFGHKIVRSLVRYWIDNPKDWKRFCFRVSFDQGKLAFRSIATGTLVFMMGIKDKTMVAWRSNESKRGLDVGIWERFELRSASSTPEMGPLFHLWYCFTGSFVK